MHIVGVSLTHDNSIEEIPLKLLLISFLIVDSIITKIFIVMSVIIKRKNHCNLLLTKELFNM